jgi:hypothetical protein
MKQLFYTLLLIAAASSCYKDNGEPLRKFTEFELGTSYDTIPCESITSRNEATFGNGSSQRYTTEDKGSYFLTERIFSSDIYQFEGDFFLKPNRSAYYTTTTEQYDSKNMRLFVKRRYPERNYLCKPGEKLYVEITPSGINYYFCGGTFINVNDNTDSIVVAHAQFNHY